MKRLYRKVVARKTLPHSLYNHWNDFVCSNVTTPLSKNLNLLTLGVYEKRKDPVSNEFAVRISLFLRQKR